MSAGTVGVALGLALINDAASLDTVAQASVVFVVELVVVVAPVAEIVELATPLPVPVPVPPVVAPLNVEVPW